MKVAIYDSSKKEIGKKELPEQFEEEFRPDIIKRTVIAIQNHNRQPYGAFSMAGKQSSAVVSRRRRDFRGSYGLGISRVPRKVLSRSGTRMNWVGAFAPGMVGGRRAHPPKASKQYDLKVNKKERRKAIRSAIAATMMKEVVTQRGHILPENFPFIVDSSFEEMMRAKDLFNAIKILGLEQEYMRNAEKKIRAGRGKSRGRKYKKNRGVLFVVSKDCKLYQNGNNLPGIEVEVVTRLNAETLAPGTNAGRLTIFTDSAIERMSKEKLFTDNQVAINSNNTEMQAKKQPAHKKTEAPAAKKAPAKKEAGNDAKARPKKAAPKKSVSE